MGVKSNPTQKKVPFYSIYFCICGPQISAWLTDKQVLYPYSEFGQVRAADGDQTRDAMDRGSNNVLAGRTCSIP
jgi:hypothetical protein